MEEEPKNTEYSITTEAKIEAEAYLNELKKEITHWENELELLAKEMEVLKDPETAKIIDLTDLVDKIEKDIIFAQDQIRKAQEDEIKLKAKMTRLAVIDSGLRDILEKAKTKGIV